MTALGSRAKHHNEYLEPDCRRKIRPRRGFTTCAPTATINIWYRSKRHTERGSRGALDQHVHACRLAAGKSTLDRGGQVGGSLDVFPAPAESLHDLIVADRQKFAAMHSVRAVVAALDFAFRIPARVVAENPDQPQPPPPPLFKLRNQTANPAPPD